MALSKRLIVRAGAGLLGVIGLITGLRFLAAGASGILGDAAVALGDPSVLAGLDNDFRFTAAIWTLVGLALVIGAIKYDDKPDLVQIGLEAVFVGGLARLFSFTEYGYQSAFAPAIAVELVLPAILFALFLMDKRERRSLAAA